MTDEKRGREVDALVPESEATEDSERTGLFTSGIVATKEGRKIALFFSGQKHAGENLADVLRRRAAELSAPIQMCDALSRNLPQGLKVILSNCMAHSRRRFVEVAENFPEECRYVIEILGEVYQVDAKAKEGNLSPEERLALHRAESGPLMEKLHTWMRAQIDEKKIEENCGLGQAILYALKRWEKLTRFLEVTGAPLDSSLVERSLKKAIIHRNNSLFYKTQNGAHVGDIFMTLIHTCELNGVDPFDYLTQLQLHAAELAEHPKEWLPWNYQDTLARLKGK